jgi:hypothetical protein
MSLPESVFTARRRLLAAAVATACGLVLSPAARAVAAVLGPPARPARERPIAAADLYAPHDLAG